MNKKITDKDKKDWEDFLSKKDKLPNKDINPLDKIVPKVITIDLHGYTLEEANHRVKEIVLDCFKNRELFLPSLSYPGDLRTKFDYF